MRRLPPLTALEAFVQVARLGSVKAAAEELALSTPALSRRVQALERFIGRPLFDRKHQALEINSDGQRLLDDIAPALDSLNQALENIQSGGNQLRLRLAVMPLFATQRLFPHLGALRQRHPQLHIDIETTPYAVARLGEGLDAAIVLAKDIDPALYAHELDHDEVYLIGRTALLDTPKLATPGDLTQHTVLLHRDMGQAFDAWKEAAGIPDLQPLAIDNYDSGQLMLEAAAQGLGVAVMHASHFNEAGDTRLARLFPATRVESPYRYYFVCRPRALQTRAVRIFRDWLVTADI